MLGTRCRIRNDHAHALAVVNPQLDHGRHVSFRAHQASQRSRLVRARRQDRQCDEFRTGVSSVRATARCHEPEHNDRHDHNDETLRSVNPCCPAAPVEQYAADGKLIPYLPATYLDNLFTRLPRRHSAP